MHVDSVDLNFLMVVQISYSAVILPILLQTSLVDKPRRDISCCQPAKVASSFS